MPNKLLNSSDLDGYEFKNIIGIKIIINFLKLITFSLKIIILQFSLYMCQICQKI